MRLLHPALFALFLVVSAYGEVRPLGSWREALACAPVLILIAGGLFGLLRLILKNADKTALLTTVILGFLGLSGELSLGMASACRAKDLPVFGSVFGSLLLLAALTIALLAVIIRVKRNLATVNQAVLAVVGALLVMTIGGTWLDRREAAWRGALTPPPVKLESAARPPDIYYIVLDSYTSLDGLREFWGYDSSEFQAFLRKNGFQAAPGARSEYKHTTFCLASRLNMSNPPPIFSNWADRYTRNAMIRLIEQSAVPALLTSAGYKVVNLSMMPLGKEAARYPLSSFLCFRSVRKMILDRSVMRAVSVSMRKEKSSAKNLAAKKRQPFSDLEAVADETCKQPRFIFAHIMLPHGPMVFNRDGRTHKPTPPQKSTNAEYLEQTIFTTRLISETVTHILERYSQPPVIILQGDHGYRYLKGSPEDFEKESYGMLSAILLPGMELTEEQKALPPVNTFRLVFNHLFNAGLPYVTNMAPVRVQGGVMDD